MARMVTDGNEQGWSHGDLAVVGDPHGYRGVFSNLSIRRTNLGAENHRSGFNRECSAYRLRLRFPFA